MTPGKHLRYAFKHVLALDHLEKCMNATTRLLNKLMPSKFSKSFSKIDNLSSRKKYKC